MKDFAERLRREECELEEQYIAYDRGRAESLKDSVQELSSYDNHPGDLGNETFERSKDAALLDNVRELRHQVREALRRIADGTFGACARCGKEIDRERLDALPHAPFCLACQKSEEAWDPPRWRPIEEEALSPPFGRSFQDRAGAGVDGEDIWQEVARYGTSNTPSDVGGTDSYDEVYVDHDERRGLVEEVDGVMDVGPDRIPPDPYKADDRTEQDT